MAAMAESNRTKTRLRPGGLGLLLAGALGLVMVLFRGELARSVRGPELLITEIMAAGWDGLADADGEHPGWIEIHNPGSEPRRLEGWCLTDDFRRLGKWRFPEVTIGPGAFVVVFASGKDRTNAAGELHLNFRLKPGGEYLALVRPDGSTVVHEYLPKYPVLDHGVSFGVLESGFRKAGGRPGGIRRHGYFSEPTPGRVNGAEMLGRVADTKFSERRGSYSEPVDVEMRTSTPGAEIRFTTDGTIPTLATGRRYERPVPIRGTTVLRAAAFKRGYRASDVDTHTYLFPGQVPDQTGAGFPRNWGFRLGMPVMADYSMDSRVAANSVLREALLRALGALPTVAVTMDPAHLFDPTRGLYSNPLESGAAWERPASVEWLVPGSGRPVHLDCGLRIQGGWSRRAEESPKHSFRVERVDGRRVAGGGSSGVVAAGVDSLRSIILRAGYNNSWIHRDPVERRRGDLVRDPFLRATFGAMGHPTSRGGFVHLYLNGLYWGIYNVAERPDRGFLAKHWGGVAGDYVVQSASDVPIEPDPAWARLMEVASRGAVDPAEYAVVQGLLDLEAFSDFVLVLMYGGAGDWVAGRRLRPVGRYRFLLWDCERALEDARAPVLPAEDARPPFQLFHALKSNESYRSLFRSRARRHLGVGGALSSELARARMGEFRQELEGAMAAESARWGDYRSTVDPQPPGSLETYSVERHWRPEMDRMMDGVLAARTAEVIQQLAAAGLY